MGKSRRLRRLAEKQPTAEKPVSPSVPSVPASQPERGVSGTLNWSGRIHAESNSKLQFERGYGTPGATEWGEWERLHRTDHTVAAALNMLAAPIRDATVALDAGEDADERAQMIADFVRDNLTKWLEPLWPQLASQIVEYGLGYGYALHERVMGTRPDDRVPGGIAVYLKKLAQRLPSSVKTDGWIEKDGELATIKQAGLRDGRWTDNIELPASSVLLSTWNRSGNNYQGFSAFRPIWYMATIRMQLLKIIAIGHERESLGTPIAMIDKDITLTEPERAELATVLENIRFHENMGLTLPRGVTLEWFFSPGANKGNVVETWKSLGLAIMELVQVQQMALGTGETGSRSVGEVHDASKNAFVAGIRAWVESVFNGVGSQPYTGIVRQLVDLNFGPQETYPVLKLVTESTQTGPQELANTVKTLVDAGALTLTEADENFLRDRIGMPEVDPAERAEKKAEADAAKAAAAEAFKARDPNAAPGKREFFDNATQPWRSLRPSEMRVNLSEIDDFFNAARARFESQVKPIVSAMLHAARPVVADAMADSDPSELKTLELDPSALKPAVAAFVARCFSFGYRSAARETAAVQFAREPRRGSDDTNPDSDTFIDVTPEELNPEIRRAVDELLRAQTDMVTERITTRSKSQIWDKAVDAVRRGRNADFAIDQVLTSLEEAKTLRTDAGILTSRSMGIGREIAFEMAGVKSLEYSAILDDNTCQPCRTMDGTRVEPNTPEHYAIIPPLATCRGGGNCRCILISVV